MSDEKNKEEVPTNYDNDLQVDGDDSEEPNGGVAAGEDDDDSKDDGKKKRKRDLTEDERLEERRAANRRSALESRQRRKNLIDSLQKQVEQLTKETTELRAINDTLRLQLDSSLAENQQFRLIISQQQLGAGAPGGGMLPGLGAQMLLGRGGGGFGGLQHGLGGVQPGMLQALGGLNPALLGSLGAGAGLAGAADLQTQLQLQQRAAAMGLGAGSGLPDAEPSAVISVNTKRANGGNHKDGEDGGLDS